MKDQSYCFKLRLYMTALYAANFYIARSAHLTKLCWSMGSNHTKYNTITLMTSMKHTSLFSIYWLSCHHHSTSKLSLPLYSSQISTHSAALVWLKLTFDQDHQLTVRGLTNWANVKNWKICLIQLSRNKPVHFDTFF